MQEKVLTNIYAAQCKHKCKIAQWELYGGAQLSAQSIAGMCNNNTNKTVGHVFECVWCAGKSILVVVYCISVLVRKLSFHLRLLRGIIEPALQLTIRLLPPQPTTRGDQMEFPLWWLRNSLFFSLHKMLLLLLLLLLCFHSQLINWPFKKIVWSIFTWLQRKKFTSLDR